MNTQQSHQDPPMDLNTPVGEQLQHQEGLPSKQGTVVNEQDREKLLVGLTLQPASIKYLVIKNQNRDKGYYCYENWNDLHNILFGKSEEVFAHMWRTLKLINFGDEYIPTGLVYDTLVTLFNLERPTIQNEPILKKLFFRFIELNGKVIFDHQKDEINYLRILRRLVEQYRMVIQRRLVQKQYTAYGQEKPRYQRLHHLHDLYVYRKNLEKLKKIDDQMKECSFQPQLSQSRHCIESRYWMKPRVYGQIAPEEQLFESTVFRAKPVPNYPTRYPSGYSSHTARIKQTFDQKSLRKNMKPLIKTGSVSEFSIQNRNNQRKQNSFQNRSLLFLIEIEVGKRKFMLKVREGMGKEEVANMIQRMVGFSDPELYDIVEEYFNNYFKRININIQI